MVTPPYDDHTPICHFDISGICHVTVDGVSQQLEFAEVYIATQQLGTFISSGREQPSWNLIAAGSGGMAGKVSMCGD